MFDCCFNDSAMDLKSTERCMGADPIMTKNDGERSAPAAPGHTADLQLPVSAAEHFRSWDAHSLPFCNPLML